MEITAEYFELKTGSPPKQDDLERANCKKAGEIAHYGCGWCYTCEKPVFMCGCYHRKNNKKSS